VLLVDAVIMVTKLVHENMQKHEGAGLCLSESAQDTFFASVARNAAPLKNLTVRLEIRVVECHPKVIGPGVQNLECMDMGPLSYSSDKESPTTGMSMPTTITFFHREFADHGRSAAL
jgi:hypothetical protein